MFDLLPLSTGRFDRFNRELVDPFGELERSFFGDWGNTLAACRTDILDRGDHYLLQAELPGFDREDIKIDVHGERLSISAEHKSEREEKKDDFVRRERHYGSYVRSFDIPGIDANGIEASYKDGVLELNLPKPQMTPPPSKRIELK